MCPVGDGSDGSDDGDDSDDNTAVIIGAVVGACVMVSILIILVVTILCVKQNRRNKRKYEQPSAVRLFIFLRHMYIHIKHKWNRYCPFTLSYIVFL